VGDKQVGAIAKIVETLEPLEEADRQAVLTYVNHRYAKAIHVRTSAIDVGRAESLSSNQDDNRRSALFADFPQFFHAFDPQTDVDKALIAGYWIQILQGNDGFESFSANRMLREMGYPIGNITRALDNLMESEPKLVHQVRKSGVTKQARKVFKLTQMGIRKVDEVIRPGTLF
jgi:hypothetical protein